MPKDRSRKPIDEFSVYHTVECYKLMYELLERIGYDISKNIHNQFCEKHDLMPDTKKRVNNSKSNKNILI